MLFHVHCKETDQLNMIVITKEDCEHLAGFGKIKNSPSITSIYSK